MLQEVGFDSATQNVEKRIANRIKNLSVDSEKNKEAIEILEELREEVRNMEY